MSLLEDVFLQDEATEAQELERVIEGDEYDERPRSPDSDNNSIKEDEAEEEKTRVDPKQGNATKRVIKNPRFLLNPVRLTGPRGIQVIPEHFKDFKFKGKGHERDDLDLVLKKLEHWAYRLYPKFEFEDCLKKIETLGKKRPVMVHLHKIRSDQITLDDAVVQRDSSSDEASEMPPQEEDEFDKLLQQQIDIARATPAPDSARKPGFSTPSVHRSPFCMPKAASSPSISEEQRERMLKNRRLAEERRLAKLKQSKECTNMNTLVEETVDLIDLDSNSAQNSVTIDSGTETTKENGINDIDDVRIKKHNRSNIIDSSDDECDLVTVNQSIVADVHRNIHHDDESCESISALNIQRREIDEGFDLQSAVVVEQPIEASVDDTNNQITDHENKTTTLDRINDEVSVNGVIEQDSAVKMAEIDVVLEKDGSNDVSEQRNYISVDNSDTAATSKHTINVDVEHEDNCVSADSEVLSIENKETRSDTKEVDEEISSTSEEKSKPVGALNEPDILMDVDFSDDF